MAVNQWSGFIQFGLVTIPVKAKAAVVTEDLSLELIHGGADGCHGKAGYVQDWVCHAEVDEAGEKVRINRADAIKGWKGRPVDEDHVKALKAERAKSIEIDVIVPAEQVDPRYILRSYDVTPGEGGEKAYKLFAEVLAQSGKVAIAKTSMADREQIVMIRPRDGILSIEAMYWPEDLVRGGRDVAAREIVAKTEVSEQEIGFGLQLAETMVGDFDPTKYTNVYNNRLREYLTSIEEGTEAPEAPKPVAAAAPMDLLAALSASVAQRNAEQKEAVAVTV